MKIKIFYLIGIIVIIILAIYLLSNGGMVRMEGKVVDIFYEEENKERPTILIEKDKSPYSVTFDTDVNIDDIDLNDTVSITTDGIVRESYPMQITGYDIKLVKEEEKVINKEIEYYYFSTNTNINEDMRTDYHLFKTKVFNSMEEYLDFSSIRNIVIPELKELNDKVIVISYLETSSNRNVEYSKIYNIGNATYIELDVTSKGIGPDDIVTKGVVSILNKDYVKENAVTLSKYIKK